MKKLNYLCLVALISCGLGLMACSDSLKSQFDACCTKKSNPNELLNNSKFKERIVKGYSQQYYEKLLECSKIYFSIYYDSTQNYYRLYTWKKREYKNDNNARLLFNISKDYVATNLFVNGWEIDKSGYSNYPDLDKLADSDIKTIENLANIRICNSTSIFRCLYITGNVVEEDRQYI